MTGITLGKAFPLAEAGEKYAVFALPLLRGHPATPRSRLVALRAFICSRQGVQFRQTPSPSCASRGQLIPQELIFDGLSQRTLGKKSSCKPSTQAAQHHAA